MFLIDDILFAPARGLLAVFRELYKAAQQEEANEADDARTRLSELYMLLETGQLTEQEFDEQEKALLDRLEEIDARGQMEDPEEEEEDAEEEDEEAFHGTETTIGVGTEDEGSGGQAYGGREHDGE